MKSAEYPNLSRTLVVGLTAAALSVSAAGVASASTDTTDNTLRITQRDYEFQVEGELTAGTVSIAVENLGTEFHEIAMAKLIDGHTVDDVRVALETATEDENPLTGIVEDDNVIDDLG